ncbi:hypothetical protein C8F01DRAFT_1143065 [Mycena amicta]|nr:hypothetical protein C8F01DRAFT_1143065 [Mycena amicta]
MSTGQRRCSERFGCGRRQPPYPDPFRSGRPQRRGCDTQARPREFSCAQPHCAEHSRYTLGPTSHTSVFHCRTILVVEGVVARRESFSSASSTVSSIALALSQIEVLELGSRSSAPLRELVLHRSYSLHFQPPVSIHPPRFATHVVKMLPPRVLNRQAPYRDLHQSTKRRGARQGTHFPTNAPISLYRYRCRPRRYSVPAQSQEFLLQSPSAFRACASSSSAHRRVSISNAKQHGI